MAPMGYSEEVEKQRIADSWRLRTQGPNAHTSTIGGAMEAARMTTSRPSAPAPIFPSNTSSPTTHVFRGGPSQKQAAREQSRGTSAASPHLLPNVLSGVAGLLAVVFAITHGVAS